MGTDVTLFAGGANAGLPAHLADINQATNIEIREQVDTLSFRGKVFRIGIESTEHIVYNKEKEPAASVEVIILDYNKLRSRALYPTFVEGQSKPPICWSNDSVTPDHDVQTKQSATCATCPKAAKGSKMTEDGRPGVACASFKRAVVVPAFKVDFNKLLVKIPQTSMYDKDNKENEAAGYYAYDQYMEMLKNRGVNNTAAVITKIKFDFRTSYPKLLFSAVDWVPLAKAEALKAQLADVEKLERMLRIVDVSTPAAEAPAPEEFEQAAPAAVAQPAAAAPAPAPATRGRPARTASAAAAAAPAAQPAPAPAPAVAPAAPVQAQAAPAAVPAGGMVFDDDNTTFIAAGQPAPAVAAATPVQSAPAPQAAASPAPAVAAAGDPLAGIMNEWATEG